MYIDIAGVNFVMIMGNQNVGLINKKAVKSLDYI